MSLQYTQREVDEIKTTIHTQSDRLCNTIRDVEQVSCAQRETEDGLNYVENQTRRNNLRIDGVAEIAAENWTDTEAVVRKSFATALKLPEAQANAIRIERAHRTGPNSTGRPRTIVVRFEAYKDRDCILQAARKEKPRGVFVNEDLAIAPRDADEKRTNAKVEGSPFKWQDRVPSVRSSHCERPYGQIVTSFKNNQRVKINYQTTN